MSIEEILQKHLLLANEYIHGFAVLNGLLGEEFRGYSSGISIGKKLDNKIVDALENGPTLEYYEHYHEINNELDIVATNISKDLKKEGINCINIVPTISTTGDELLDLRYKISHKMVATRAGLGWIGKSDLFISQKFGPRVRLVSILLEKPIENSAKTIDKSRCETCSICVDKCPAQAANGKLWDIETDRDEFFDAHKCREKCAELAKKYLNRDIRICGICVSVCPIGKKS
jgi:epoxyqueuosine reductase QueG